ncbi:TPA: hypothetical protein SMV61_000974 [Proteus mirabilis]|nr:hypothetical protein [Proteus mirabilis]
MVCIHSQQNECEMEKEQKAEDERRQTIELGEMTYYHSELFRLHILVL